MSNRLLVIGTGDLSRQIHQINELTGAYEIVGFVDDLNEEKHFLGLPVLGKLDSIKKLHDQNVFDCLIIGIGYNHLNFRDTLYTSLNDIPFGTIIHPSATIESKIEIGAGSVIYANVFVGSNTVIEANVILNIGTVLPHDNLIGRSSFLSCNVLLGGFTSIGRCVFMGLNATALDNISVCAKVVIGASSLITKSIVRPGCYYGIPVKLQRPYD